MHFPAIPGWGLQLVSVVGFLRILAEGLGCGPPRFLAGVCRCWWGVLRHSWLGAWGVGPRHSWLGSAAGGGGLCAVRVQCVWCALSGVVVCGVLFVIPPLVPLVFVLVPVWVPPLRERLRVLVLVFRVVGGPSPSKLPWCVWVAPRHVVVRALFRVCVSWACGCVCVRVCGFVLSVVESGARCRGSGVRALDYAIPVLVPVVGRHGHNESAKIWSCKCVTCGWGGGAFRLLTLSLAFVQCFPLHAFHFCLSVVRT